MNSLVRKILSVAFLFTIANARIHGQPSNIPPTVSILWPSTDCGYDHYIFGPGTVIKIKANATDPDGSVAQVQFFADGNLIGVVSNAPFSRTFNVGNSGSTPILQVVAVDNLGAATESAPIQVLVGGGFPRFPVFEIIAPRDKSTFAVPGMFVFSAELLASPNGDTGPVHFFVGTNEVGVVTQSGPLTNTTAFYSLNVTNIAEGDFSLRVWKYSLADRCFATGYCTPPDIRVTKLGMQFPRLAPDGRFELDVVTSFSTNQNVIEASSNLLNWVPITTNVPSSNTFTFTEPSPATNSPRFYRAVVPAQ
jgi:hypothetical protein